MEEDGKSPESFERYLAEEFKELQGRLLAKLQKEGLPPVAAASSSNHQGCGGTATVSGASTAAAPSAAGDERNLWLDAQTDKGIGDSTDLGMRSQHAGMFSAKMSECESPKTSMPPWQVNWARVVGKMIMSTHQNDGLSIAGLTMHVLPGESLAGPEKEEVFTAHGDWLRAKSGSSSDKPVHTRSSFAASLVAKADAGVEFGGFQTFVDGAACAQTSPSVFTRCVLHPDTTKRFVWALFGAALLMWDALTIPLESVELLKTMASKEMVVIGFSYWTVDIIVHAFTGYTIDGHLEMRPYFTIKHYAKTWLPLDIGVLTLDALLSFLLVNLNSSARVIVLVRLLRLIRLARLHKWVLVFESFMRSNTSKVLDLVIKIGWLLLLILMMCHYVACAWYWIGVQEDVSWGVAGSWVDVYPEARGNNLHSYFMALHWSITQFTPATNNIVPSSTRERAFAVGVVLWGMLAFSVFLSSITATVNELKTLNTQRTRERFRLVQFIKSKRIHANLGSMILMLFDMDYDKKSRTLIEQDMPVLSQLPESIRIRMHREYFLPYLKMNTIVGRIFEVDQRCFLHISHEAMSDHRHMAQQEVFLDGVESRFAYVVAMGNLTYHMRFEDAANNTTRSTTMVHKDSWLSEGAMWVSWTHRGSLVADSCAELVKLNCDLMRSIVLKAGGNLSSCMRCCALLFAHRLEEEAEAAVSPADKASDLGLPEDALEMMASRALRFCSQDHLVEEEQVRNGRRSARVLTVGTVSTIQGARSIFSRCKCRLFFKARATQG